jgi:multiple sugar transport system permease protein
MFFPLGFTRLFSIFEIARTLKLHDTRLGLILPYLSISIVMYTFILKQNFLEIPLELEDAARIDGCSELQIFLRIMVPLAREGIVVVAVLCFITVWGEYLYAVTLTLDKARTLPVGLSMLTETTGGETAFNILAAAYSLAILPAIVLFIASQRVFMRGLTKGALKF